jgi:hypothetical protein
MRIAIYLFLLLIFSCNKGNIFNKNKTPTASLNDNIPANEEQADILNTDNGNDAENNIDMHELFPQEDEIVKTMYVTSKDGLNIRTTPSLKSEAVGIFLYGEAIKIYSRGERITIDGISDYWYITYDGIYDTCWVFGGYLSKELPLDVPVILGEWEVEDNRIYYYRFRASHYYFEGEKKWDHRTKQYGGEWELNKNLLTLNSGYLDGDRGVIGIVENIQISIINRNNIILIFPDGEQIKLIRCDVYTY